MKRLIELNNVNIVGILFLLWFLLILTGFIFKPYLNIIESPKPIIPELRIKGNGIELDTIYIYKLKK